MILIFPSGIWHSKTTKLFTDFFNSEKASGLVLIACTVLSLTLANSNFGANYHAFFQTQFAGHSFEHWINDGLMTIFFLLKDSVIKLEKAISAKEFKINHLKNRLL